MGPQKKNWHQTAVCLVMKRRCFSGKCHSSTTEGSPPSEKAKEKKHPIQTLRTTLSCGLNAEIKRQTLWNDSIAQEWNSSRCNWNNDT